MARHRVTLPRFAQVIAKMGPEMEGAVITGLQSAALDLDGRVLQEIDNAKPYPAVDRGELRNSRDVDNTPRGAVVAVKSPHAAIIEYGTRPFFPPTAPLAEWAKRKGLANTDAEARSVAFLVARKISETGIAPRFYFTKAFRRFVQEGSVAQNIRSELNRISRTV